MDDRFKLVSSSEEVTSFNKTITFNYEGEQYVVDLFWDRQDGYDLSFKNNNYPNWYWDWTETESVEYILDCLTEDAKKVGA